MCGGEKLREDVQKDARMVSGEHAEVIKCVTLILVGESDYGELGG